MLISYQFIAFLLVLFVLYYLIPRGGQWIFLLAASLLFYAAMDARYLIFILVTSFTVYGAARPV